VVPFTRGLPLLGCLLAWTLVLACLFFSLFCWVLSFYKAPLSLVDMLHATGGGQLVEGSVLSGSLFSSMPTSFGLLLARTLVLALCFFLSPFVGCFLFIKLPSF